MPLPLFYFHTNSIRLYIQSFTGQEAFKNFFKGSKVHSDITLINNWQIGHECHLEILLFILNRYRKESTSLYNSSNHQICLYEFLGYEMLVQVSLRAISSFTFILLTFPCFKILSPWIFQILQGNNSHCKNFKITRLIPMWKKFVHWLNIPPNQGDPYTRPLYCVKACEWLGVELLTRESLLLELD